MPETINNKHIFSLFEVNKSIQNTLNNRYKSSFWVKAEMNKLNLYKHSGHCYPELVEKKDGKIIAQMKAHLWKDDYNRIDNHFKEVLKEPLKDCIKILFEAKITFDPLYGLALWIIDIDPNYTLGDLEKEKQETILSLKKEQLFDLNKTRAFALLPQRIAIISVETSKGFADFLDVLHNNPWHYKFFYMLFPALLQGDRAAIDITKQLDNIRKVASHFDVVAIIRGGGGDVGLSCYNNYELAKTICNFPLPVITGIGHATNETVSEMTAYYNAITPTKLAEFLIQKFHNYSIPIQEAERKIIEISKQIIHEEKARLKAELKLFRSVTDNILNFNQSLIKTSTNTILNHVKYRFKNENYKLKVCGLSIFKGTKSYFSQKMFLVNQNNEFLKNRTRNYLIQTNKNITHIEKNVAYLHPQNILKRGYSITYAHGKVLKNYDSLHIGDEIKTQLYNGNIVSTVKSKDNHDRKN